MSKHNQPYQQPQQPHSSPQYPPQNNYYNNQSQYGPPQHYPNTKKSNAPVIIVVSILAFFLITTTGYFALKLFQKKTASSISPAGGKNIESSVDKSKNNESVPAAGGKEEQKKPEDENKSSREANMEEGSKTPQNTVNPLTYLPKPYMKYTFEANYQDGDSGKVDVVTGVIKGFSIVTSVELIEQSEAIAQHFVDGPDGVYTFSDEEINDKSFLWLPFDPKVGQSWDQEGVSHKIVRIGAVCDLGNRKFDNCIVMEVDYSEAGAIYECYIAPGFGTVLIKDKGSKNPRLKLLSAVSLTNKEADEIVIHYSPNAKSKF